MKQTYLILLVLICSFFASCSSGDQANSDQLNDGLEIIKVDLSEAREGKLSEFFEAEVQYIWLKDESEDGLIGNGLQKIFFHEDKVFTLDIFGCHCVQIFDRSGKFLSKIRAYGEGPEKYLNFDDAIVVNNELLLLGVFPPKLMWFSLEGKFIREEKLDKPIGSGVFSEEDKRYYFYSKYRELGEYLVETVNESFRDTLKFLPYQDDVYYGNFSNRNSFIKSEKIYLGRAFNDTIMVSEAGELLPKFVFEFGEYGQAIDEMKRSEELEARERSDFINKKARLYFTPYNWYITNSQFHAGFKYEVSYYNIFFDRKTQQTSVIKGRVSDDLTDSFDPYNLLYQFEGDKVGFRVLGIELYKILQKKKEELGQEGFEKYVKGKGKNFAQAAFAAKDSENPVLIVFTVKK